MTYDVIKTDDIPDGLYWFMWTKDERFAPPKIWAPVGVATRSDDTAQKFVVFLGSSETVRLEEALAQGTLGPRLEPPNVM